MDSDLRIDHHHVTGDVWNKRGACPSDSDGVASPDHNRSTGGRWRGPVDGYHVRVFPTNVSSNTGVRAHLGLAEGGDGEQHTAVVEVFSEHYG